MDSEKEPGNCGKCKKHTVVKLRQSDENFAMTVTKELLGSWKKTGKQLQWK